MTDETWKPGQWLTAEGGVLEDRYHFVMDGWRVSAHWPLGHPLTAGPATLDLTPDGANVPPSGITSSLLRKVETILTQRRSDPDRARLIQTTIQASWSLSTAHYIERLKGHGPWTYDGDYYGDLLKAVELLKAAGDRSPNQTLTKELGLPMPTLKSQLKRAREERKEGE